MDYNDEAFDTNKYFTGCQECGGTGFKEINGIAVPCRCWKQDRLRMKYVKANIPIVYQKFKMSDLNKNIKAYMVVVGKDLAHKQTKIDFQKFLKDYIVNLNKVVKKSGLGLFLYGGTGVGKTLVSILILKNALWYSAVSKNKYDDFTGYFTTFKEYLDLIFKSNKSEESAELLDSIKKCDVLVMDEVGAEVKNKDQGIPDFYRAEFDDLLRYRSNNVLPTIITTNLTEDMFKEQYNPRSGSPNINRIWSIVEGNYVMIRLDLDGRDYRRYQRIKRTEKLGEKYKIDE